MLTVNGQRVPVKSRTSDALRAYNSKGARLQYSTSNLRFKLEQGTVEPTGWCSGCGKLVLLSELSFWFQGEDSAFYTCGCGKV